MSEHAIVVCASSSNDTRFLAYLLSTMNLGRLSAQAAQPGLSVKVLAQEPLLLPPLEDQRRIASIVGSIDELIENNRQRVEVLEAMVRAIYREWFVCFLYPGAQPQTVVGRLPGGWETRRLKDVATTVRGRSYRKSELVNSAGIPFINLKCFSRGGGFRAEGIKQYAGDFKAGQVVVPGDIVLAVTDLTQGREILARATRVPRLAGPRSVISLDVVRVVPHDLEDREWILATLRWSDFADRVKEFANGSTVLHLSPTHIADAALLWPPSQLREQFSTLLTPILGQVDVLNCSSVSLAEMRDLLLPRLVSGEIDVSSLDLDALVESAVA